MTRWRRKQQQDAPVHLSESQRTPALDAHLTAGQPRAGYADPTLPCHGCAHSAAGAPFPGFPSGERPCGFCVRNPALAEGETAGWFGESGPVWYDGWTPPFKVPMDCYISTDRLTQHSIFDAIEDLARSGKQAPPREQFITPAGEELDVWCCEGGPAPGGHTWTCSRWIGSRYG